MADITRENIRTGSLLASTSRVEAPFVRVTLGGYTFGVYQKRKQIMSTANGVVTTTTYADFPNYIKSLSIKKINGTVNNYTLDINYPITENTDPNFFERLLSSTGVGGNIQFSYGDFMMPNYIYRDEEAIITNVTNRFDLSGGSISYTIEAWSASKLALSNSLTFPAVTGKPSDIILGVLRQDSKYHLLDVFTGMRDIAQVEANGLIAGDDKAVTIPTCTNTSALEYIAYVVSYMTPVGSSGTDVTKSNIYSLTTYEDTSGVYGGPYFKVQKIVSASSQLNQLCTYDIDIGYPTANVITSFSIKNNENWSVFYNYNKSVNNSDYVERIDDRGELSAIYSPLLANVKYSLKESDKTWWTKVTQYPISATLTLKGLLRPVVLMTYVKLNVWFYGTKHIASGYYLITSQVDTVSESNGYTTTLELLRVASDDNMIYAESSTATLAGE